MKTAQQLTQFGFTSETLQTVEGATIQNIQAIINTDPDYIDELGNLCGDDLVDDYSLSHAYSTQAVDIWVLEIMCVHRRNNFFSRCCA